MPDLTTGYQQDHAGSDMMDHYFIPEIQGFLAKPHAAWPEIMQKPPDYFIPSCVSSVDGIRALSICEMKPSGLMMLLSFSVLGNCQVCDF